MSSVEFSGRRVVFRGSATPQLKLVCVTLLFIVVLISTIIVGRLWLRMFLFLTITLGLPVVCILWALIRWSDWFYLDDKKQKVVQILRQSIPYEKIEVVSITQLNGYLSVSVKTGRGRSEQAILVNVLDSKQEPRLKEELAKRFPDKIAYRKVRRPAKWRPIIFFLALFCVFCAMYAFQFVSLDLYPWTQVIPEKKSWESAGSTSKEELRYNLGGISFRLPEGFERIAEHQRTLVFRGTNRRAKLKVAFSSDISAPTKAPLLRYGAGINDEYDFLNAAYYARFGILFLASKGFLLSNLYEPGVYAIEQDGLKGFVVRGTRRGIDIAKITLVDREKGQDIKFTLSSLEPIDDETLGAIIGSVRSSNQPKSQTTRGLSHRGLG